MAGDRHCPLCRAEVPADAADGLCPECLFRQAIEVLPEGGERAATGWTPSPAFVPPPPAELARRFPSLGAWELLGQGGMGAVYKARQTKLDRLVAVKVLPPEVARDPAFAERFLREARALARLNHPHIVTVYDFGDVDGLYYFTMEYVDGQNLRDRLRAGPLPAGEALGIVAQLCDALQYAHDGGLVHRDIKPENILLDRNGRVKVADFGLAKLVGLTPAYLTLTGAHEMMGTLLYMAPEQMTQAHGVDHRADLYSLGVVLYEMLTGELPLGRFAPPSRKAAVGERLDQVVLRALAREPAERYQDAAALRQGVEAAMAAPGAAGRRLSVLGRRVWPGARFTVPHPNGGGSVLASGMVRRDEESLIIEVETARKKFLAFFTVSGKPQEVRIPLDEVTSLTYGWGWGKPPHSVIVKVSRLGALGGMPGSGQGRVELVIPAEDRDEARSLVESIRGPAALDWGRARREVAPPALGLLATGAAGLLTWAGVVGLSLVHREVGPFNDPFLPLVLMGSALATSVQVVGAALMLRLRAYPWATTAAILALIPLSPVWVLGLPFGIWACIVLGRPEVTGGFFGDRRQAASGPAGAGKLGARLANRFLSLAHSFGRYMLTTMPGWKRAADDPQDAMPPTIEGPVRGPGGNTPGGSR